MTAFLHYYHHGATVFLCYTELMGICTVSWAPIMLNLTVHVVMYWYYFQRARGIHISWKKWVTRIQIIQFFIALGFIYTASYYYLAGTVFQYLPKDRQCPTKGYAAVYGNAIMTSYLGLFISFYFHTYKNNITCK